MDLILRNGLKYLCILCDYNISIQDPNGIEHDLNVVRFVDFTAVTMKNAVFWDLTPFGSCKNRRFG
jgi:hypothetical protein